MRHRRPTGRTVGDRQRRRAEAPPRVVSGPSWASVAARIVYASSIGALDERRARELVAELQRRDLTPAAAHLELDWRQLPSLIEVKRQRPDVLRGLELTVQAAVHPLTGGKR